MSEAISAAGPKPKRKTAAEFRAARAQAAATRSTAAGDSGFYDAGATTAMFLVEIDQETVGRFTQVDGLSVEVKVETVEELGENGHLTKLPGRMEWPNLKLSRGITESDTLLRWFSYTSGEKFESDKYPDNSARTKFKLDRFTLSVVLIGADGTRLRQWDFDKAFPVKWSGPSLATSKDDLPEEELEIAHHGFRAVPV